MGAGKAGEEAAGPEKRARPANNAGEGSPQPGAQVKEQETGMSPGSDMWL